MKAEVSNSYNAGDVSISLTTCFYARKRNGTWNVHLNYHKCVVKYNESATDKDIDLLKDSGLTFQSSRDNDWITGIASILGLIGIALTVIDLIKQVMETLADVSSLLTKIRQWLIEQLAKIVTGQEPTYQTQLEQTLFVINLMKDGVHYERRLPRWRQREKL